MDEAEGADPVALVHATNEALMLQVERYSAKVRALALATAGVTALLAASYVYQIFLGVTGPKTVTVDLSDPGLVAFEVGLVLLALVWLGLSLKNYRFVTGLSKQIEAVRGEEAKYAEKYGLS